MDHLVCLVAAGSLATLSASETSEPLADSRTISTPGLNLQGCQALERSPLPYRKSLKRLLGVALHLSSSFVLGLYCRWFEDEDERNELLGQCAEEIKNPLMQFDQEKGQQCTCCPRAPLGAFCFEPL